MEKVLQVQNLSKSYGSVAAVSGLSLSVARGRGSLDSSAQTARGRAPVLSVCWA